MEVAQHGGLWEALALGKTSDGNNLIVQMREGGKCYAVRLNQLRRPPPPSSVAALTAAGIGAALTAAGVGSAGVGGASGSACVGGASGGVHTQTRGRGPPPATLPAPAAPAQSR